MGMTTNTARSMAQLKAAQDAKDTANAVGAIPAYKMPAIKVHNFAIWYPDVGALSKGRATLAEVMTVHPSCVEIRTFANRTLLCPHVSDPRLKGHKDQWSEGAWDYAPVEKRLQALEHIVSQLVNPPK